MLTKFQTWCHDLRQKKDFRVFVFTVFNALIAYVVAELALPNYAQFSLFAIPFLNMLSKWINNKYFGDIGVDPVLPSDPIVDESTTSG